MENRHAPMPPREAERLEALREYEILDTDREQVFDDLAALASYICGAPISAISLVDSDRQWFKASVGLTDRETPRNISFCQHAILEDEILVVPDATVDDRFKDSPLVTEGLKVQFYAGVPLVTPDGSAIGALCVNDVKPRSLTEAQLEALKALARQVVGQLELRRKNIHLEQQTAILEGHAADLLAANTEAIEAKKSAHAAMEEMRIGEERFHLVCQATKDVVWDLDLTTGKTWLSPNYRTIFKTNLLNNNPTVDEWMECVHPEDRPEVSGSFEAALSSGASSWQKEYRLARCDGSYVDVFDRAFLILDEDGKPIRVIGAVSDLTDRKQSERDRHERDNAERANLAKSEFLSRMSHELRTPLNSILGFAQLLEMYQPTEQQSECITRILKGGKHLLGLINEVLDLSRIESGTIEISLEAVKVANVVDEAINLTQPLAHSHGVTVARACKFDTDLFARADRQRLLQIVINLISNAVKYNVDGGSVSIECFSDKDGHVTIGVHDTGLGIGKELAHRVFMPFDRLGVEQKTKIEGTGLGLALSKSMVEAMHGHISFKSDLGIGTTFFVELVRTDAPGTEAETGVHRTHTASNSGTRILYIEDNESNVALMESIIAAQTEWSLEVAMTGNEGLRAILADPPDMVLLDQDLPDMPGYEVLLRLSAMRSLSPIPVLVVSADATPDRIEKLLAAGANGYVTKPFDIGELLNEIASHLASGENLAA